VAEYSIRNMHPARCEAALKHLPLKIAETGVQALVIDTIHFYIELVPLRLDIPYVHIWNAHHVDLSGASPACYFTWPYETTAQAQARNAEGVRRIRQILAPVTKSHADEYGLSIDWNDPYATLSKRLSLHKVRENLISRSRTCLRSSTMLVHFMTMKDQRRFHFRGRS